MGVPSVVIGLPRLLETVGRATAQAQHLAAPRFVELPDLHHALDYIPDESNFWADAVRDLIPGVVAGLTEARA